MHGYASFILNYELERLWPGESSVTERDRKSGDSPLPHRTRPGTWKKSMRVKLLISLTLIACSAG